MDFIVFSGLVGLVLTYITFSYDIVCQWSRNLATRVSQLPPYMRITNEQIARSKKVIPKFYIWNHGPACQSKYSLNFLKFSARINGEDPERFWAHINPASMSTREMSDGLWEETIDDHARSWNFRKITEFGTWPTVIDFTHHVYLVIRGLLPISIFEGHRDVQQAPNNICSV